MPIRYSCFISYPHGEGRLVQQFVTDLKKVLADHVATWLDKGIYLDEERLGPGTNIREGIAQAICQSVCMIVVYSPRYEKHAYCLREYAAMEQVEARRRALIKSPELRAQSMIIPVIFRGKDYLPPKFQNIKYLDFENYVTPRTDMWKNNKYVKELARTAKEIYDLFLAIEESNADVCSDCDHFTLPPEDQVKPWREPRAQLLPTR